MNTGVLAFAPQGLVRTPPAQEGHRTETFRSISGSDVVPLLYRKLKLIGGLQRRRVRKRSTVERTPLPFLVPVHR